MLESVHNTLILSGVQDLTQQDVDRALTTCGWDIERLVTLKDDPVALLIPEDLEDSLTLCYPPRAHIHYKSILHRVTACIFIEPMGDLRFSYRWRFFDEDKRLIYHYHPELFPRNP